MRIRLRSSPNDFRAISNSTGTVTYLHHDQQGSTRLLTGSTGTVTGKCTYNAYGTPTCEGTTTTPLGYDGQYTSTDTGLIYLRARAYDPATAQFLTVDPAIRTTGVPYAYASDNPLNYADPTGLMATILCETEAEQKQAQEQSRRLLELHRQLEQETSELEAERQQEKEENESFAEQLLSKTVKAITGCWAGSDVGTVAGTGAGATLGGPAGAVVGGGVGAVAGCAVGGLSTGLAPVNPLQPSEGGP